MSNLLDTASINDLSNRLDKVIDWLFNNVFSPQFYEMSNEYAILSVKLYNFYKINKL